MLAALFTAMMMGTHALADDLILPQTPSEPIVLRLSLPPNANAIPSESLVLFVGEADPCCKDRTPISGRYQLSGDSLSFSPAFGFETGQNYVARLRKGQDEELVAFRTASAEAPIPAAVTTIFPSADQLPENVLRFYIHFSAPMQPHVAFDYITLRDADGTVDDAAFMRFKQELWNEDRTRLTVLIDPGRIKRNVATNVALGPALVEGQTYTLAVDGGWPAADGQTVLPAFEKRFSVAAPLRTLPSLDQWTSTRPCARTHEPLTVTFDRPFDRHLLPQQVHVLDGDGGAIEGIFMVGRGERSVMFTPDDPWFGDTIQVSVNATLEDVAANNFQDLLDHVQDDGTRIDQTLPLPVALDQCSG